MHWRTYCFLVYTIYSECNDHYACSTDDANSADGLLCFHFYRNFRHSMRAFVHVAPLEDILPSGQLREIDAAAYESPYCMYTRF